MTVSHSTAFTGVGGVSPGTATLSTLGALTTEMADTDVRKSAAAVAAARAVAPRPNGSSNSDWRATTSCARQKLRDPRRAVPVVAWSFVIWLISGTAYYLAFKSFDFPMPFTGALVLQGFAMIGIAAPSAPSGAGVFEAAAIGALTLYGIDNTSAGAYGVAYHVATFLPITLLGAWSAVRTGITLKPPAEPA